MSPPLISSDNPKQQLYGRFRPTQADLGPYHYVSMGQVSPTHHPSFSAKAPRLHEIEVLDPYVPLLNLIFDQGIGSGLVQKEGGWAGGYGMDKILVAYEDGIQESRGPRAPGHRELGSGLGCANTFAPYCIYICLYI